jgi:glycosyltransferase involved in cell wall biosynthesis
MRIAFVGCRGIPALYSGFETAATEICVRLVERGHDVTVYCRKGYGDESQAEYKGVKKKYLPRLELKVADTLSHTLLSLLHLCVNPPDVILMVNPANGPLCIIPRLRRTPFAINVDGLEWERGKWPYLGRKYFYFASWFCTKIAPAVIADSHGIQRYYRENWGRDCYFASYGAYLQKSRVPGILERYGLQPREYLLIVARLEPENNTDLILKAFSKVMTDKKLVIIGGTNYKSRYVSELKENTKDKRVSFLGGIYDQVHLAEIMCNCFAYIHGHMVGGTNPVLLQALGCGACTLYLDCGLRFNAEVVGDAGLPFPRDASELTRIMQGLLDTPETAQVYRKRGPERIRSDYTWDIVTDRYEALCKSLCADRLIEPLSNN